MTDFTHSLAIIIGIDAYANGIPPLTTAVNDATRSAHTADEAHSCPSPPTTTSTSTSPARARLRALAVFFENGRLAGNRNQAVTAQPRPRMTRI
jgi:hypothetical protein